MSDPNDLNHQKPTDVDQAAPLSNADQSDIFARLIKLENAIKTDAANTKTQSKKENTDRELLDRVKAGEVWMIGITILIFLVSVFQAYETWTNNSSTGKQVERIIDATNRIDAAADSFSSSSAKISRSMDSAVVNLDIQAKATQKAAGQAAIQAANIEAARQSSMQQSQQDQRAWISVVDVRVTSFSEKDGIALTVPLVNTGKTPALHISEAFKIFTIPENLDGPPANTLREKISTLKSKFRGAIGPASAVPVQARDEDPSNAATIVRTVKEGTMFFFIIGNVRYDDIYGKPHYTELCLRMADLKTLLLGQCDKYTDMH